MAFENFGNIISLLCTIIGLLYCVFKYVETQSKGFKFIIAFFLANFLSEYYWTIYELITNSYPDLTEFVAYLGWNIGFFCLLAASFFLRSSEAKKHIHPLMFLPILINLPQLILYCTFGGIFNNIWEVGVTTATAVFCLQELLYYFKNKDKKKHLPLFAILVLLFLATVYGKWTTSCFTWSNELRDPYVYLTIIGSIISLFFMPGASKYSKKTNNAKTATELRFQVLMEIIAAIIIIGGCTVGFFTAISIKNSLLGNSELFKAESQIALYLFIISAILIALIIVLLYVLTKRYRHIVEINKKMADKKTGRINFIVTLIVTLVLMVFVAVYSNVELYKASVVSMYEDGDEATETTATELESYLTVATTTLRVTAESVDLMVQKGSSKDEILEYIVDQTTKQAEQFDENFTGIYALIDGEYMDGTNWVPPEGYDPLTRDWYNASVSAKGEVVIVSPYLDMQTGSVVITIGKMISDSLDGPNSPKNVVCIDVILNHIKDVTKGIEIAGKGYGMVVNSDGFIIAHKDEDNNGKYLNEVYDEEILDEIVRINTGRLSTTLNDKDCSLFIYPVMNQWYVVLVIDNIDLYEDTYIKLAINIIVTVVTFGLIAFFYYINYKNEQIYGKKVEEMNIQIVTALAAAIDAKDKYTNGHSSRVAEYAKMIAREAGLSEEEQDEIYMAGLLHDVGKIGVPDEVINKNTTLTKEEFDLIKNHPIIGNSILEGIKERPMLATGARWHHERYDGSGYPDGLKGNDIPYVARIIAVADAYDAMTSKRSYRDLLPREKVIEEIKNGKGTQFDPVFAEVMLQLIEEDTEYLMRETNKN